MLDYRLNVNNNINNDPNWLLLEKLYNNNFVNKKDKKNIIPKKIHQIWLGCEMSETSKILAEKMMNINKEYEYTLWTDDDVDDFGLKNKELFYNIKNLGAKSDIFRYEILERLGGIYIDTDFECIKPFDDILNLDFFAGHGQVSEPEIFNSIIGCVANNKIISSFVNSLLTIKSFDDNINGVMNNTGPYFITKCFYNNVNENDNVVIFPTKYFFSFPAIHRTLVKKYNNTSENFVKSFINENSIAIHLWQTTWQK